MKTILLFLILYHSLSTISSAQNKLSYQLTDFDINVNIDTLFWRQVGYQELKEIAKKHNIDLDARIKMLDYIAAFNFIPRDSLTYPPATFISIEVLPIENQKISSLSIDSSLNIKDLESFLFKMKGGSINKGLEKYYFDRYTGSLLFKFLTYMSVKKEDSGKWNQYIQLPDHYYIEQSKEIKNKLIRIGYYCYETQQEAYFPKFERIIKSFH